MLGIYGVMIIGDGCVVVIFDVVLLVCCFFVNLYKLIVVII